MKAPSILLLFAFWFSSPALLFAQHYHSFPHFASGGGWISDIYLTNQGSQTASNVQVSFFDDSGAPLAVATNLGTNSTFSFSLAPGETKAIQTSSTGNFIVGHIIVCFSVSASVRGSEIFRYVQGTVTTTQVGVPLQSPFTHYSFPVEIRTSSGVNAGIAIANLVIGTSQNQEQNVILDLIRTDGTIQQTAVVKLAADQHTARFLDQLFPGLDNFSGALTISAPKLIGVLGLRVNGEVYGGVAIDYGPILAPFLQSGTTTTESEPNNDRSQATPISRSGVFVGSISSNSDLDYFSFTGKRDDIVTFMLDTQGIGSNLDSVIRLMKADGTILTENDQNGLLGQNDSFLQMVLPEDGIYYLRISDYSGNGGASYSYRLHASLAAAAVPVPQITALSPSSGRQGETVSLTITGTNLSGTTAVNFTSSSGITVSGIQATATQVTCSAVISSSAAASSQSVTVSTPGGTSNALPFTINAAVAVPQITSLSPSSGKQGETVSLTITGTNLSGATAVNFTSSSGITVSGIQATATQVTCSAVISSSAATGSRSVTVSTPGGTSNALPFTVNAAVAVPQITSLNPSSGKQGETVSLTISGTNLSGTTAVNFTSSTGITVSGIQATATQVTCSVAISSSATTGSRSVTVTMPDGTSNSRTFTITSATVGTAPTVSNVIVNTPTYSSPIATFTGSFDFSDPDGDIIYTGSSTGSAKIKFSVSIGAFSCYWTSTGSFLDRAGQTSGHVQFTAALVNPNSLTGDFLVSFQLLDAAGNQSNSITFGATVWYCENFKILTLPDGSGNRLFPALPAEWRRPRDSFALSRRA